MDNSIGLLFGLFGAILIPVLLILIGLWLLNAIFAYKLAKDAGYAHPAFAFIPVGSVQLMVICNSLGGISGEGPSEKIVNIMTIISCLVLTGFIPVVGQILAIVSFVVSVVMIIFTIIHVVKFCNCNGRGWIGPILCWILIPIAGFPIMCSILRKQI